MKRKNERLTRDGLGDSRIFRDSRGREVSVEFIERKIYRRDEVSEPWENVGEEIPRKSNASYMAEVLKNNSGAIFYVIDYYRILL
jgi:hypothetical protein